jgi:hypothetical protein
VSAFLIFCLGVLVGAPIGLIAVAMLNVAAVSDQEIALQDAENIAHLAIIERRNRNSPDVPVERDADGPGQLRLWETRRSAGDRGVGHAG